MCIRFIIFLPNTTTEGHLFFLHGIPFKGSQIEMMTLMMIPFLLMAYGFQTH